jgi:hypothetical protein
MDWANTSHVMQAIFWALGVLIFSHGYQMGDRL